MIVRNMTAVIIATTIETTRYTLKPGVNDVPPEVWAKWREQTAMKAKIKLEKVIEPEKEEEPELLEPEVPNLEKLSQTKAVELVKQTFDLDLLERWVVDEKRERVLKALEKQLEAVEVKAKKDGKKGEGQGEGGDDNTDPEGGEDDAGGEGTEEKPKS